MGKVFISYSRQDSDFADKLTTSLEQKGVPVWVDRSDIKGGSDWRRDISEAIRGCRAFLLIISSRSTASQNVDDELYLAREKGRAIFPILYETCELPAGIDLVLSRQQRISFTGVPFEKALQQVLDALPPADDGPGQSNAEATQAKPAAPAPQPANTPRFEPAPVPVPPQLPPLNELICGRWNVVSPVSQSSVDLFPNGAMQGQMVTVYGTSYFNGRWQIAPPGVLNFMGQIKTGWDVRPFMLNIQFNQVTPAYLTGVAQDGTQSAWYRLN